MGSVDDVLLERLFFIAVLRWWFDELELSEVRELVNWLGAPPDEAEDFTGEDCSEECWVEVCWL